MAKKSSNARGSSDDGKTGSPRGGKSKVIRTYLKANKQAKPTQVVNALHAQGVDVSRNMVTLIRAQAGVKKARRQAQQAVAQSHDSAAMKMDRAAALEASFTLYKAARGLETRGKKISEAFLLLVEILG